MTHLRRSVCVFCGAGNGNEDTYLRAARDLGAALAEHDWRLVYGAGDVGLMGAVAQAARDAGAATFGVIPQHLLAREQARRDLSMLVVTETMHERKKVMFANSDAIVVLPGGAGTLDEFFEVLTWKQLGLHARSIYLVDIDGYWAPLNALIAHVVARGFAHGSLAGMVRTVPDVPSLVAALAADFAGG